MSLEGEGECVLGSSLILKVLFNPKLKTSVSFTLLKVFNCALEAERELLEK